MSNWQPDKKTHRSTEGNVATHATSKIEWARISAGGKIHRVDGVILRWNFYGGTWDKPDMTFLFLCGPQRHALFPVRNPNPYEICARCDSKYHRD